MDFNDYDILESKPGDDQVTELGQADAAGRQQSEEILGFADVSNEKAKMSKINQGNTFTEYND